MSRINYIYSKICSHEDALRKIEAWKLIGQKVVFTNGCFDILHKGHVTYLAKAADLGDRLVIALNTDESIKQQGKGDERPINQEDARLQVIASLGFVDMVILFEEQTPYNVIKFLKPDVLVKGADYDPDETDTTSKKYIVGSDIVRNNGGEVKVIDIVEGFSTTKIVNNLSSINITKSK